MRFFDYDYDGPAFVLFGPGHLVALALIAGIVTFLLFGGWNPGDAARRRVRLSLASILLVTASSWYIWSLLSGFWTAQEGLPLHICSVGIWTSIYMLAMRSYPVYEIVFFFGIAGATQAVLTPSAGDYGLPHFWAVQTLASHGLLIIALVYMTTIEGFRPTWKSVWKTMIFLNAYALLITASTCSSAATTCTRWASPRPAASST